MFIDAIVAPNKRVMAQVVDKLIEGGFHAMGSRLNAMDSCVVVIDTVGTIHPRSHRTVYDALMYLEKMEYTYLTADSFFKNPSYLEGWKEPVRCLKDGDVLEINSNGSLYVVQANSTYAQCVRSCGHTKLGTIVTVRSLINYTFIGSRIW